MIVIMIFVMSYTHFFLSWLLPVFYPVIISNSIFLKLITELFCHAV